MCVSSYLFQTYNYAGLEAKIEVSSYETRDKIVFNYDTGSVDTISVRIVIHYSS